MADISSTRRHAISVSDADGSSRMSWEILSFQRPHSFFRTERTMTGLHVAPTVPFPSIDSPRSASEQESFHSTVGVVRVMSRRDVSLLVPLIRCLPFPG